MIKGRKLKVAIVVPPIAGHKMRGTGNYTQNLYTALNKIQDVEVSLKTIDEIRYCTADVIHFPYFDPFFLTLPFIKSKPTVVTVHDLIPLRYPSHFPSGLKGFLKWNLQKISLWSVDAVITDSVSSQNDIEGFADIKKEKIHVIYLGVTPEFSKAYSKDYKEKVIKSLSLPQKFVLNVGDINYNKNIPGLLKAFSVLVSRNSGLKLILVGEGFTRPSTELVQMTELMREMEIEDKVLRVSSLDVLELAVVYQLAQVYVQPSFAEGFGLPVLEAFAAGCPVVVANTTSLPEVVGSAAVMFNPQNTDTLVKSISLLLKDKGKRDYFISQGKKRAKLFTWEKCARETAEIYRKFIHN
ncbi:glycosyltransferase family 4 protein [Patescibacteria group bacterium]|nr:glycosyltransferase family 4 protein [Patescibacteria group bacterium]MCL5798021.1 glycosyltransferase family 4 protein [Patescibacteria group bacterium]